MLAKMTRAEIEEVAEDAAEKALQKFFLTLGYDTTDPKVVTVMQDHFRFVRRWHDSTEAVKAHSLKTAISVIVTGILGWIGLVLWKQP